MVKHTGVVLHCSASDFGNAKWIDKIHRNENHWKEIGYHYVITSDKPTSTSVMESLNGQIETGRSLGEYGAHAKGYNDKIGICIIGDKNFSMAQINSAVKLIVQLMDKYNFGVDDIIGHYECEGTDKSCPNINMDIIRYLVNVETNNL